MANSGYTADADQRRAVAAEAAQVVAAPGSPKVVAVPGSPTSRPWNCLGPLVCGRGSHHQAVAGTGAAPSNGLPRCGGWRVKNIVCLCGAGHRAGEADSSEAGCGVRAVLSHNSISGNLSGNPWTCAVLPADSGSEGEAERPDTLETPREGIASQRGSDALSSADPRLLETFSVTDSTCSPSTNHGNQLQPPSLDGSELTGRDAEMYRRGSSSESAEESVSLTIPKRDPSSPRVQL
eukprot:TRINITY_DN68648_c0_g1_i1.p1 TRINITY_DN68648_c0_g1~~TRINITY_DN68648_c0_g1_i1.p1  ORF type:complete len:253 (+),score=19.03 TRINITY_DN68648_c0_g1_i1:54-761(+)